MEVADVVPTPKPFLGEERVCSVCRSVVVIDANGRKHGDCNGLMRRPRNRHIVLVWDDEHGDECDARVGAAAGALMFLFGLHCYRFSPEDYVPIGHDVEDEDEYDEDEDEDSED